MQTDDSEKPQEPDEVKDDEKNESSEQPENIVEEPVEATEPEAQWTFHGEDNNFTAAQPAATQSVSWTASEYVAHQKTFSWFLILGASVVVLSLGIYLLTHDFISIVMVALIGIAFGIFAARQPQVLSYVLDEKGLQIGSKFYPYEKFKSFSIIEEGPIRSILLMPMQRFMLPLSVYYDPDDEANITEVIGSYLPLENRTHDMVDRFMRKIRF